MSFLEKRNFVNVVIVCSLLFFFIFPCFSLAEIFISEIMFYDDIEWIEFYANGSYDISNLKLKDNYQSDDIVCCTENCDFFVNDEFFLIFAKNKIFDEIKNFKNISIEHLESNNSFDFNSITIKYFCVDDSLIGNGLGNQKDDIILFRNNSAEDKEQILLNFSYDFDTNFNYLIPVKGKSLGLFNYTYYIMEKSPFVENSYSRILFNFVKKDISNIIIENNLTKNETFSINLSNVSIFDKELSFNNSINQTDFFSENITLNTSLSNNSLISYNLTFNEALQNTKIQNSFFNLTSISFFNSSLEINISGYKGNTSKRAIYVYLENYKKNKTTFYVNSKFSFFNFSLRINYKYCGYSHIIVEGLDIVLKEEVNIPCHSDFFNQSLSFNSSEFFNHSMVNNIIDNRNDNSFLYNNDSYISIVELNKKTEIKDSKSTNPNNPNIVDKSKKQYNLLNFSYSSDFYTRNYFSALLEINNLDNISHFYKIHFYAYNGTKRFSDDNIFEINIKSKSNEIIFLENKINKNFNGIIKVKIKIFRDDRKTAYEITNSMNVYFVEDFVVKSQDNKQDYDLLSIEEQSNNMDNSIFKNNSSTNYSVNSIYDNLDNTFLSEENNSINFDTTKSEENEKNFSNNDMITGNVINFKDFKFNFKDKSFLKYFILILPFFIGIYFLLKKH
ncbi:MAG: hypothetical protein QXE31_01205 [Candidatus Woesearchaeota archaeon]